MSPAETAHRAPSDGVRLAGWGLAGLVVAVVRDRLWATPNLAFFVAITRHLGSNPFPKGLDGDYLLTNLTGPVLARVLGQTSPQGYVRLHLAVLVLGLAVVTWTVLRRFGYRVARTLVWVLAASPAVTVCAEWLGQPDVFTLSLGLAIVVCRRRWVGLVLAVLLGLTHPEQGAVAALAATVAHALLDERDPADEPWWHPVVIWGAVLLGGVIVGRGITEVYLRVNHIVISRPRTSYLDIGFSGFWHEHTMSPIALLYSLWGPLWLVLGYLAWRWWRSGRGWGPVPVVGLAALAALVPIAVTLDETRVYAMTTAPLLIVLAVLLSRSTARPRGGQTRPVRTMAVVLAVIALGLLPGEFNAGDSYWATALPPRQFARFLRDGTVPGGPDQLSPWLLKPFGFSVPQAH